MAPIRELAQIPDIVSSSGIGKALHDFPTQHEGLFILAICAYTIPTFFGLIGILALSTNPRQIPYFHPIFLTDGVLICCCPLAAILPTILWPLVLVYIILARFAYHLHRALKWFASAPTFCGIHRNTLRRCAGYITSIPIALVQAVRNMCGKKNRKRTAAAARETLNAPRQQGYGTVRPQHTAASHGSGITHGRVQYQRMPNMETDASSILSAPPPYSTWERSGTLGL